MEIGSPGIQIHPVKRICDDHRPMVFRKNVLAFLFLQFHAEIRVSFHGSIHGMAKDIRINQVPHANPDPDFIRAFLTGHI
jgi:hypothetical protein